jgi:lipoteichoic acid synthase
LLNKSLYSINFGLKDIIPALITPAFFIIIFYSYFYIIASNIYGNFNLKPIETFVYLPIIFKWSFISCIIMCLFFGILREYKKPFAIVSPIFLLLFFIIYTIQYFSLYLTNRYLMPESFLHVDQIALLVGYQVSVKTIIIFLFVALLGYVGWFIVNRFDHLSKMAGKYRAHVIQSILTVSVFIVLLIPGLINLSCMNVAKQFGLSTATPEIAFADAVRQFYFRSQSNDTAKLPDDLRDYIWRYYGISYKQHAQYPLVKEWVYKKPIPFDKVNKKSQKPNIIIFFMESLSANLVGSYNSRMNTPNIDSFADEGTIIDGYYNHTFPTISGIRGQLCSFYPVLGENEHAEQEGIALKLFCLPHVLNRNDYSTYFFFYSPALYTPFSNTLNMKKLIETCGFNKVYTADDIQKQLTGVDSLEGYNFKNSVNDLGMMTNLVKYLQAYKKNDKPFFIALSTMGTHPSIDDTDEKIGESLNKLDDAFGVFWEYFRKSPYYDNTIIVLTADHAIPPTVQYKKFIGSKNQDISFYDKISLIIFDKRYNFPKRFHVKANSIDLVPTVLQLLDINNVANSFQGLSIFSDRREHPFLLCTLIDNYYIHDLNGIHNKTYTYDKDLYEKYSRMTGDIFSDQDKQETGMKLWFAYNKYLNNKNKIWNGIFEKPFFIETVK